MKEELDFTSTIIRLMRLTHQGKLEWSTPVDGHGLAPTYTAKLKNLHFRLEHVGRHPESVLDPFGLVLLYRLVISDVEKKEEIVSPPIQAANDLAAIIRGYDEGKLEEINRLLDAEL